MAISQRTADVVYSRGNLSILSTMNVSAPTTEIISPSDLLNSFETIFGVDASNPVSQYTMDSSSSNAVFLTVLQSLFSIPSEYTSAEILSGFRGILAAPLLIFQPTWLTPNFHFSPSVLQTGLPPELYVNCDLSQSFHRLTIPKWTWIAYAVISGSIYVWCVGGMVVASFVVSPPTTPFEVLDFASRIVSNWEDNSFVKLLEEISIGKRHRTRMILQDKSVFVREVLLPTTTLPQDKSVSVGEAPPTSNAGQIEKMEMIRKIGFASSDNGMGILRRKSLYH